LTKHPFLGILLILTVLIFLSPSLEGIKDAEIGHEADPSAALKQLMARHTSNDAWLNIRPPLVKLIKAQTQDLYNGFDALGHQIAPTA